MSTITVTFNDEEAQIVEQALERFVPAPAQRTTVLTCHALVRQARLAARGQRA